MYGNDTTFFINNYNGRGIWSESLIDDGIAGITSASGESAIYGWARNSYVYYGYFEGGNFIIASGNVGIGATSPTAKLDVRSNAYISGKLRVPTIEVDNLIVNNGITFPGGVVVGGTTDSSGSSSHPSFDIHLEPVESRVLINKDLICGVDPTEYRATATCLSGCYIIECGYGLGDREYSAFESWTDEDVLPDIYNNDCLEAYSGAYIEGNSCNVIMGTNYQSEPGYITAKGKCLCIELID